MQPLLTNAWASLRPGLSGHAPVSALFLEATSPPQEWSVIAQDPLHPCLELKGLHLNFPPTTIPVLDGLLHQVTIQKGDGTGTGVETSIRVDFSLEHPSSPVVIAEEGIPCRLVCSFDRREVRILLQGCPILVDAGHGGRDAGGRGPINLLEKNVVLKVARALEKHLEEGGAVPVLTRTDDRDIPPRHRFAPVREGKVHLAVSLHTANPKDASARGVRTLCWTSHPHSRQLGVSIHAALLERTGFPDRGLEECPPPEPRLRVPGVTIELVCLTNPIEEAWMRSSTFVARLGQAITRGIKNYLASYRSSDSSPGLPCDGLSFEAIPVRTPLLTEQDDMVEVAKRYTQGVAAPGDVICVAESPLAVTQGRAVVASAVKPGPLARFLSRFPDPDGSLGTPAAMQLAIDEAGVARILLGGVAAALGRVAGRRGDFFRVAGQALALIDDIAGTMPPYDRHVVLGPKDPDRVARAIKEATGIDALVADVNDIRCVDILAFTGKQGREAIIRALRGNPFGNDDQCTPIVVLKPVRP